MIRSCMQALRVLQQYAVPVEVQQLDELPNGAQLQSILKKQYKHHTVPCVFINRQVEYIPWLQKTVQASHSALHLHQQAS